MKPAYRSEEAVDMFTMTVRTQSANAPTYPNDALEPSNGLPATFTATICYEPLTDCSGVQMTPKEVHDVLAKIGAKYLHHANTVTTSCTFLEHGALLSRGYVEDHGFKQTPQESDALDKKFGIWDRVFLDHVDIHYRGGRRKGPNQYGPVLFVLDLTVLLQLPKGTEVGVTKTNPIHWRGNQKDADRWYLTPAELTNNISY